MLLLVNADTPCASEVMNWRDYTAKRREKSRLFFINLIKPVCEGLCEVLIGAICDVPGDKRGPTSFGVFGLMGVVAASDNLAKIAVG